MKPLIVVMISIYKINKIWNVSYIVFALSLICSAVLFLGVGTWIMFVMCLLTLGGYRLREFPLNSWFFRNQLSNRVILRLPGYKPIQPYEFEGLSERASGILNYLTPGGIFVSCDCTRDEISQKIELFLARELKCRIDHDRENDWPTKPFCTEIRATSISRSIVYLICIVQSKHHPRLYRILSVVKYHKLGSLS